MIPLKSYSKTVHVEEIVPNVIEPSFGIGRIIYTLLEHTFKIREKDEQRTVNINILNLYLKVFNNFIFFFKYLSLPPLISPLKCCILPLLDNDKFTPLVSSLCK